jgi:putative ABC transport system permease protein
MDWRPSCRSFSKALLRAYPAEFREEYGAEMERLVSDRASEPRLWITLLADVIRNAPREHLHILLRDLKHSVRLFARAPGFTATALVALALGIGAAVTIFTLIDAVLLRSLPFGSPDRLAYMWTPAPRYRELPRELSPSFTDVFAWRRRSRSFESITAFDQRPLTWYTGGEPIRLGGAIVLGNFFRTIEASAPLLGRAIDEKDDDPGAERVAVISYGMWNTHFNRDAGALGKSIDLGHRPFRIVGVMPEDFSYPKANDFPFASTSERRTDVWIPLALSVQDRANRFISCNAAIGRLRPDISLERAQAEMSAIESALDPSHAPEMRGAKFLLTPFIETAVGPVRPLIRLLSGAVILVLLIACGNVANLLMARAAGREHEMGVRTAAGAPRSRLVRQLLTESVLLSGCGGILGAALCFSAVRALANLNPGDIPRFEEISVDGRALAFAMGISLLTGIVFGAMPALTASRVNVADLLREGGGRGVTGGAARIRRTLAIADVALAVALLGGATLFIRSYLYVEGEAKGFAPSTLTINAALDLQARVPPRAVAERCRAALERVRALPGVAAAGGTSALPLSHRESKTFFRAEGYPNSPNQTADARAISGDYFAAMQISLLAGRYLTDADMPAQWAPNPASVAVSDSFARQYFPGRSAIGGRIQQGDPGDRWSTIVGVVADVRHSSLEAAPSPTIYSPSPFMESIAVRTALPPDVMIASVRRALHTAETPFALTDIQTMRQRIGESGARRRFQTVLLASFAGVAVFLALVGLYGLLSYGVRQRTAEIGVRMALGAARSQVVGLVVGEGLALTAAGVVIGLAAAAAAARSSASLLYGIPALDPVTFVAVPALMAAASTVACMLPAWRAARVDPARSLRR